MNSALTNRRTPHSELANRLIMCNVDEWAGQMGSVAVDHKALNSLVLNYLVVEGFKVLGS